MVKVSMLLFIVLIWLQYSLWFGKNGISDYKRISESIAIQQEINIKLKDRNDQLFADIDRLNNN